MRRITVAGIGIGLAVTVSGGWLLMHAHLNPPRQNAISHPQTVVHYFSTPANADFTAAVTTVAQQHHLTAIAATSPDAADLALTSSSTKNFPTVDVPSSGQPTSLTDATIVSAKSSQWSVTPGKTPQIGDASASKLAQEVASQLQHQLDERTWSLKAIGDIIIGRSVYTKIRQYDALHPFAQYSGNLAGADLTVADLENAFSDRHAVIADDGMTFVSPSSAAAGLKSSGIDAVNLANNHSFNGGAEGLADTIATLDQLGVAHVGAGQNTTAAHQPYMVTIKQTKVALLGYSSIVGSTAAGADSPGLSYLDMAPWGQLNATQLAAMANDIQQAKAAADVVLVYYHWGTEYTHDANTDQREVAHRAIDAGADVVLGTHPHWVQGIEWYHDRLITYNLGNFVFDQEWARETKQGTILDATFNGSHLITARFEPYTIVDWNQPTPATPSDARQILQDIYTHSWWPSTEPFRP